MLKSNTVWQQIHFSPSHNASLSPAIIFPGQLLFENPSTFELTDTLLSFVRRNLTILLTCLLAPNYRLRLLVEPITSRAKVEVLRARNLTGSLEDKTATLKVTAGDDTSIQLYTIYFNVERETPSVKGTLFVSELAHGWGRYYRSNLQVFNPLDEYVDLSDYAFIILNGSTQFGALLDKTAPGQSFKNQNAQILRPGYKVTEQVDGTVGFEPDLIQTSIL